MTLGISSHPSLSLSKPYVLSPISDEPPVEVNKMQKPPFTIPSPGYEKVEGETLPRRNRKAKDGLIDRPAKGVGTVWDLISRSARLYPDRKAVGSRKLITIHNVTQVNIRDVDGKLQEVESEWNYFELSPYQFVTYEQYYRLVRQLGSGLHKLGMPRHSKLHMFATTRYVSTRVALQMMPIAENSAHSVHK